MVRGSRSKAKATFQWPDVPDTEAQPPPNKSSRLWTLNDVLELLDDELGSEGSPDSSGNAAVNSNEPPQEEVAGPASRTNVVRKIGGMLRQAAQATEMVRLPRF